ncbi:MAG: penicillin acylase family protein [Pseudomonadales bacterium]|nr:penicillin acylase family protein [Gammaproteobacteria bacterium]MDP6026254.1 penicillin acylase family protein [Pseudomonadales bacterium]MDP7451318.1 penicillin acylase family protein [Arenicellales bacterium]MDP6317230.1 penicillin acylase family protein [Pseudomonadales bacterium]MDP7314111.1 penicillin acylase family protein [Pseudomonadales bacterium]
MPGPFRIKLFLFFALMLIDDLSQAATSDSQQISGLSQAVEIIKDRWGISHIYARNQSDLFFAQGYNAARDRLFQFEIWRRRASGTLAEIQGVKALAHDKGTRLLRFRGNIKEEMSHYHEDGEEIIISFVRGVNAYIEQTRRNPDLLPFEFKLLGIEPGLWTPEVVISRHNALTGGISTEIMLSKTISTIGAARTREMFHFYRDTYLAPFTGVDLTKITDEIMASYRASRSMPGFEASDLQNAPSLDVTLTGLQDNLTSHAFSDPTDLFLNPLEAISSIGSNNWVISGARTKSGKPLMANDPHRRIQSPSLRYMVHLNAPASSHNKGWNVIGGGEPVLPGISIGHNDHGAWGLTIFRIDQEDLYIYQTNPDNPNQYLYKGRWKDMEVEHDNVNVKGQADSAITLKYSVHGPVIFEDPENHLAYGMKAAWLDIGATPYLASLRMDQARTWEEFRDACSFSGLPGENMVWADKYGNIGWQSVGLTPVRFGWDGSLPVPGNGDYEWAGYVPIKSMPHLFNPESGWYGTANNYNIPDGYPNIFSDFYSDPARIFRLQEVLNQTKNHTIEDSMALQYDNKSMNAEKIIPYFKELRVSRDLKPAISLLTKWDHRMDRDSAAAALFDKWEQKMLEAVKKQLQLEQVKQSLPAISREKLLEWIITTPEFVFGPDQVKSRNRLMTGSLAQAVDVLANLMRPDIKSWSYGKVHYAEIVNPFSHLLSEEMQHKVNTPALPRGGASNTLNANWGNDRQISGGSFRIIVDTNDWDKARGTNTPGQSGDPRSRHYADTFEGWNKGEYFPVYFSRKRIEDSASHITVLKP